MKRMMVLLLSLALLIACVPTPEEEFIVNKADHILEQKLDAENAASEPAASRVTLTPQTFPAHWQKEPYQAPFKAQQITGVNLDRNGNKSFDTIEVTGTIRLTIDAEIVQKSDGLYPVYRTRSTSLEKARAAELLDRLYATPTAVYVYEKTKSELNEEFQAYLDLVQEKREWDAAGRPDREDWDEYVPTEEEVSERSKLYMEQIDAAPDRLETKAVSDFADLSFGAWHGWSVYDLEDGHTLSVTASESGVSSELDQGIVYPSYEYEWDKAHKEGDYRHWQDVTMPREEADRTLLDALSRTGLTDFAITWAYPANLMGQKNGKTASLAIGWVYKLHRNYGNYPVPDLNWQIDRNLNYEADKAESYAAPIMSEMLDIMVGPNGVLSFCWYYPREIVGQVNENVELLPFDTVTQRAENAILTMLNPLSMRRHSLEWYDANGGDIPIKVDRMILSTYTIRERNADTFYELPCWLVFYGEDDTDRHNMDEGYSCLILNAVDGSIVHPETGY